MAARRPDPRTAAAALDPPVRSPRWWRGRSGRRAPRPPVSRRARWWRAALRRVMAVCCAVGAVLALAAALRPPAPHTVPVVVAARDLPAGARLDPGALETRQMPAALAPPGAHAEVDALTGGVVVGPMLAGEAVTASRLLAGALTRLPRGRVAAHLVVADPAALALTPAGTRVTVFPAAGGRALARHARILAVDAPETSALPGGSPTPARGVVLDLSSSDVDAIFAGQRAAEGAPQVLVVPEGPGENA